MPRKVIIDGQPVIVPDDATDEEINQLFPPPTNQQKMEATGAKFKAAPAPGSWAWFKEKGYRGLDVGTNYLPAVGATAGALLGGGAGTVGAPGAGTAAGGIAGATIGGAGGEALSQLIRRGVGLEAPATSGEAGEKIGGQGLIQGGIQAATAGLGRMAPFLKRAAVGQYERALAPTTLENKMLAREISPQMIQRGIHGNPEALATRAGREISSLSPELAQAYAKLPPAALLPGHPISKTLSALESMKSGYMVEGKVMNPSAVDAIEGVQATIAQHGNNISPQSLRKIKQIFDESVSEAGGYTTSDLTTNYTLKSQREAASTIRNILHQHFPDVAALDKEMSFWLDVQQVTRATALRQSGQQGGLLKTLTPLGVGVASAAGMQVAGHGGLEAGATAAGFAFVAHAVRTPGWRTLSAVSKDRVADALARGDVQAASALIARFGLAASTGSRRSEKTNPSQPQ